MLFHGVNRQEWDHDRRCGFVPLIFRVIPIVFILTDFQAACPAKHHINNADVAKYGADPLRCGVIHVQSGHKDPGPEDHLAKIIGAAHQTEQSRVDKTARIFLLGMVLLQISSGFQEQTDCGDQKTRQAKSIGTLVICKPEKNG